MVRYIIFFIAFLFSNFYYGQHKHNHKVKVDYDELMIEINNISKANAQYVKYDSLLKVIDFLNHNIEIKDSFINDLNQKVKALEVKTLITDENGVYIVIGAFREKNNANNLLNMTTNKNNFQIYTFPFSRLNYVAYKIKSSDSISWLLKSIRQNNTKDAWILKVSK